MNVHVLGPSEVVWSLGQTDSTPHYFVGCGDHQRQIKIDPFPSYTPDVELVKTLVTECEAAYPLTQGKSELVILGHDSIERANGITFEDMLYKREDGTDWADRIRCYCGCNVDREFHGSAITIVLFAKRIPIHPSLVRYLVPHEYGHAVFHSIRRSKGYELSEEDKLHQEYMKLRGVEWVKRRYEGGKWHLMPTEIIANDFRVLVMKRETEFWPHPEVPLPSATGPIADWWRAAGCRF